MILVFGWPADRRRARDDAVESWKEGREAPLAGALRGSALLGDGLAGALRA